jgi:hypothetical protein
LLSTLFICDAVNLAFNDFNGRNEFSAASNNNFLTKIPVLGSKDMREITLFLLWFNYFD